MLKIGLKWNKPKGADGRELKSDAVLARRARYSRWDGSQTVPDLAADERPQAVVPPNAWQQARVEGDWGLVGCTVAPGFQFSGFEMAPEGFKGE